MKNSTRPTKKTLAQIRIELDKITEQVALFPKIDLANWHAINNLIHGLTRFDYPSDQLMELGSVISAGYTMALIPNKSQTSNLDAWFRRRNTLIGYINTASAHKMYSPASVGYNLIEALRKIQNKVSLIK